jgi:carbonic anhydrase
VVLGHTKCRAIRGACDHLEMGNLTALLTKIKPAVDDEKSTTENRNSENGAFVDNVSTLNVKLSVKAIMEQSPILNELIESGEIGIVGGMHDITSGLVTFYDEDENAV